MKYMVQVARNTGVKFNIAAVSFSEVHPCLFFCASFVLVPMLMLLTIFVSTAVIAFPIAWIGGWL